jgi:hypothetical protein
MSTIKDQTWYLQESLRPPTKPEPRPTSVSVIEINGEFVRLVTGSPVPDPED